MRRYPRHLLSVSLVLFSLGLFGCGAAKKKAEQAEKDAQYHYNLAYGHYFNSARPNVDAAMHEILKSLTVKPDYPEAHMLAGLIYLGREQYVKSIRHFKRSLEIKPKYYAAANNLGAAYLAAGRWNDAIELYSGLVGQMMYATPGHGHNNLGWAYYKTGKLKEAQRHFAMAINLAPQLCPAYNNLGMILIEMKRLPRAEKYLNRASKCSPSYPEPYYHLGRLSGVKNDMAAARRNFEACVKRAGDTLLADKCAQRLSAMLEQ